MRNCMHTYIHNYVYSIIIPFKLLCLVQVEPSDVMEMTEKYSVINGASETIQYTAQNYPGTYVCTKVQILL